MALSDFYMITGNDDTSGLVWGAEVQEGKYFAELQTGIIPQLVHLLVFDMEDDNMAVYNAVQAFKVGDTFDPDDTDTAEALNSAVIEALAVLNA